MTLLLLLLLLLLLSVFVRGGVLRFVILMGRPVPRSVTRWQQAEGGRNSQPRQQNMHD